MIQVAGHQDQPPAKQLRFIGRDSAGNYVRDQVGFYPNHREGSEDSDYVQNLDDFDVSGDDMHLDDDDEDQTIYNQFDKEKDDDKRVGTLKIKTDDEDDATRQAGDEDIRQQGCGRNQTSCVLLCPAAARCCKLWPQAATLG